MKTQTSKAKLNSKKVLVNDYILNAIDGEGYEQKLETTEQKLKFLFDTFKKEYAYPENLRYYKTHQNTLANWIMGLPSCFNIDFENYRILEIAKLWGDLPENATEKQEDKIIDNWFQYIAAKTMQLWAKYKIQ